MTTKEYLNQAYQIDRRINSKIEQVASLKELALKVTAVLSDMPKGSQNIHSKENIITKMLDLENEINEEIDELIDLKRTIGSLIKSIENPEYQTILEQRYLCFKSWEEIAVGMGYSMQHTFRLHGRALKSIKFPKDESKCD